VSTAACPPRSSTFSACVCGARGFRMRRRSSNTRVIQSRSLCRLAHHASLESVTERLRSREAEWNAGGELHWVVTLPPAIARSARSPARSPATPRNLVSCSHEILAQRIRDGSRAGDRRMDLLGTLVWRLSRLRCRQPRFRSRSRESGPHTRGHSATCDRSSQSARRAARCVPLFQGSE
jgi:hypothetical protein